MTRGASDHLAAEPRPCLPGADAGGMTDSDKITLQLHLDVMEFGRQLERFGVQGEQLPAFGKLLESVTPGQAVAQQAAE